MFLGVNILSLDAKGRMAVPAMYRARLEECCDSKVVITVNPRDHNLWIYPEPEWLEIARKVSKLPPLKQQTQKIQQLLLGHAAVLEIDSQGRILLPTQLRSYAGLDKRVAVVGSGSRLVIWDEVRWNDQRDSWLEEANQPDSELSSELEQLEL